MIFFLDFKFPIQLSKDRRRQLTFRSSNFVIVAGQLYNKGIGQVLQRCVPKHKKRWVILEANQRILRGHQAMEVTKRKILQARLWWPTMSKYVYNIVKQCDMCQRIGMLDRRPR